MSSLESSQDLSELITWQKKNFYLRIVVIIILLLIGARVLYNHYGVPPSLEDQKLMKEVSGENIPVIDCRAALVYYAEREGLISQAKASNLVKDFNITFPNTLIKDN